MAIIALVAICVGLMSNPKREKLTVVDYARQFIEEEIKNYENAGWADFKIIEIKYGVEKIAVFDNILPYPIEIWNLKYRLKPDTYIDVMPSGLSTDEGWITEAASDRGKTVLVFSYENSNPKYLGYIRSIEEDFSTPRGQEIALRKFLEEKGLLPHETYSGNHIVVKFPLSTEVYLFVYG